MSLQPLTSPHVPLQFADSSSCKQWIEQLTLTNVQLTQQVLTSQLASLGRTALPPLERLKILEALREAVHFVQSESSKRYAGKGLPLDPGEMTVWKNVIALWQEVSHNYQQCLKAYREGDLAIAPHAALLTMRCLRLLGDTMRDYYRSYRQPPGVMWRSLHELYSFAEQHGFARIRVQDSFAQREPDSSCAEVYVQVVLAHLANPFSLSVRQMGFVQRWLERWATLVGLAVQPPPASAIPLLARRSQRGARTVVRGRPAAGREPALSRARAALQDAAPDHQSPQAGTDAGPARTGRGRAAAGLREPADAALRAVVPRRHRARRGALPARGAGRRVLRPGLRSRPGERRAQRAARRAHLAREAGSGHLRLHCARQPAGAGAKEEDPDARAVAHRQPQRLGLHVHTARAERQGARQPQPADRGAPRRRPAVSTSAWRSG